MNAETAKNRAGGWWLGCRGKNHNQEMEMAKELIENLGG